MGHTPHAHIVWPGGTLIENEWKVSERCIKPSAFQQHVHTHHPIVEFLSVPKSLSQTKCKKQKQLTCQCHCPGKQKPDYSLAQAVEQDPSGMLQSSAEFSHAEQR